MTMSDTNDQVSASAPVLESGASETGDADGQEVNKAKDPAADGGGSLLDILKRPSENCVVDDSLSQQNQPQSKSKSKRGISFPPDNFVSGYCEPPDPWKTVSQSTPNDIAVAYKKSCEKHGTKPISKVLQQIEGFACNGKREEKLVLKGEKLDIRQCESLEEILRRVQFKSIDLESCHLDDETAVVWFDMIEYYESTVHLNISYNKNISVRGWQSCSRLTRRTPCLTHLDLRNCDMNDRSIPVFGRALKLGCHITVLHMENMYLSGRSLIILVAALKQNETLQELFLADNRLMPTDGIQLGNLIKYNHFLTLLDLRNNHLQDVGVGHICDGLSEQNLDKGLRTLVLWNNQITYQAMASINKALGSTKCLETLNLGHNNVTNEGIHILKDGLLKSKSLMRLGLQSTRLTCEGAVALAEYVADSSHLLRLDLRENDIKTAGLMALSLALKVNDSVTRMDIDKETKKESGMKDYAEQQRRLQQEIKEFLERNQRRVLEREEEERRHLEERAEAEMAARASAEAQNVADQELAERNDDVQSKAVPTIEMLYEPPSQSAGTVRRPSLLLMESHILTPQETLESPLCTDIHVTSFSTSSRTRDIAVPEVALSVSSPPLSLELQNPLTAQLSATLSSQVGTSVTTGAGAGDGSSLVLPLANPLVTAMRSPPVELLLSPQYYPKPTARRIFSVTRVVENMVPTSPTVSQTGLLDASQVSPATAAPAVQQALMEVVGGEVDSSIEGSGGGHSVTSTPSPITPQLLMQDLSMKTVNEYIQQIVSENVSIPIVGPESMASDVLSPALSERPEVSAGELAPSYKNIALSSVMSGDVPESLREITEIESGAGNIMPRTWGSANSANVGDDNDDVFASENEQEEGRLFRQDHETFADDKEEHDVHPDLDPLGVLKTLVIQESESSTGYAVNRMDARNHVSLLGNKDTKSENIGCDSVLHKVQGLDMSETICSTRDVVDSLQSRVENITAHKSNGEFQVSCERGRNVHMHATDDDSVDHNCACSLTNDSVKISKSVDHEGEAVDLFSQKTLVARNIPAVQLGSPVLANIFPASDAVSTGLSEPLSQDLVSELLELDMENSLSKLSSNTATAKESSKADQISGKYPLQNNVSSLLPFDNDEGCLFKESALLTMQGTEESPLFKDADRVSGFEFSTEDLSLFEPTATASATAFCLSAPSGGSAYSPSKESEREVSPGAGDSWLTVDASSCSEAGLDGEGTGVKKEPELFTLLSHNGLTQELALALNSTDDAEIHVPDEFERELDAMLASVKSDLPWPLQQDQLIVRTPSKHPDGEAENSKLQQPFAC